MLKGKVKTIVVISIKKKFYISLKLYCWLDNTKMKYAVGSVSLTGNINIVVDSKIMN